MIKKILFLLLGTVTFVTAKAETTDYKLDVHDFSELVVVDGINVDYFCKPDSAGIAVFSCEPEMASHIMFSQKNDRLTIRTDADEYPIAGARHCAVVVRKVRPTPPQYPRRYAKIKQRPLL